MRKTITTVVQFRLPQPISLEEATRHFESSAPNYRSLPGLIRKYYLRAEDGHTAGGVYLWESRAAAEAAYNTEWREHVTKVFGGAPQITWFDTPVIVDNAAPASKAA
ncbi:YdhR family protein [Mesorhizobium sp. ES1-4]|uniref:YdhR family protein n=1 Tax=Mesorhizobium sp. ES1-4 TaxID=2876627 RepID=UPI001CC9E56A|nr:YdhR family protein [Mesorhizobium sp. ES1-4]MBZ9794292.1 YdhR family protein [Mesorhizobium sp. ES1-4]